MSGKILYIAYHYPPITVSSGVHRTLAFTRYLVDWGWDVSVLTADYRIYPQYDLAQLSKIPRAVSVIRAWGKDTARHLSFRGRYSKLMALPDRYQSWVIGAVLSGLQQIRRNRPDVIVSTYPIASAHVVGYVLHKITGIPWIADFRDPMAQEGYPEDPLTHRVFSWIEKKAVEHARYLIFTTEGAKTYYEQRYAGKMPYADQMQLIENGYDETVFARMQSSLSGKNNLTAAHKLTLVHSGVVYPSERNPEKLFQALQALKSEGVVTADNFALTLRATGHDDLISGMLTQYGITDLVSLAPSIPYEDALQEMSEVDVLLLLQANNCND
ncbi:MAG: glycosyltransferase, partial [Pseudomonadales bacterium]|nr:glycosyltransferase [Pseudomonadales bacterium]